MTDPISWENIPDRTPGTDAEVRARINHVFDTDPFVRMFSPEIRACMVEGIVKKITFDRPYGPGSASVGSHETINRYTKQAMAAMPLGFVTDGFKEHMQSLVAFALRPFPEYDDWHRPV